MTQHTPGPVARVKGTADSSLGMFTSVNKTLAVTNSKWDRFQYFKLVSWEEAVQLQYPFTRGLNMSRWKCTVTLKDEGKLRRYSLEQSGGLDITLSL